jgi:hypothetical protein
MLKAVSSTTNAIGALNYKGAWNASTNTPTLASGAGTKGDYYVVSTAGATALDGISNWGIGDWVVFNGATWQRVEGGADLNGVNLTVTGTSTLGNLQISTNALSTASGTGDVAIPVGLNVLSNILRVVTFNRVGINNGSPSETFHIGTTGTDSAARIRLSSNGNAERGGLITFEKSDATTFYVGHEGVILGGGSASNNFASYTGAASNYVWWISNARAMTLSATALSPNSNNNRTLGTDAARWSEVFAVNGTINTSDARVKTEVRPLDERELAAAKQLAKEIGAFKFLDAIAAKGDAARTHIGMTVQRAIEIMESHDLNPFAYGFICYDEWGDQFEHYEEVQEQPAQDAVFDAAGNMIKPPVEYRPYSAAHDVLVTEAGNQYGFRADQLLLFIARGFEARLSALEGE